MASLGQYLGKEVLYYRDFLYNTVSGCKGKEQSYENLRILYRTFPNAKLHLNEYLLYADVSRPLGDLVIEHMLDIISQYRNEIMKKYDTQGIRFLIETNGYLYFSPRVDITPTEQGVKSIC